MSKWLPLLVVLGAIAGLLYRRRRTLKLRLKIALWVALLAYGALFTVRLVLNPPETEQWITLASVAGALGAIWLALWLLLQRKGSQSR